MRVLAIYNLKGNEALLARQLATVLGKTVYEASSRVRAPGGGPSVLASFGEPRAAEDTAAILRERGFDVLLLDDSQIEEEGRRFVVRGFKLGADAMQVESRRGRHLEVPYADIDLLLRGIHITWQQADGGRLAPTTRKFSLTRAALSGGLLLTKKVKAQPPPDVEERLSFLHLYGRNLPPLVWRENEVLYQSLGRPLLPSRQANFTLVVNELRRRCPQALYDERLATRGGQAQLLGSSLSPDTHLDVAISVLAATLRQPAAY